MTTYSITKTLAGTDAPAAPLNSITITVDKRTPARTYSIYIPAAQWPNIDDVPSVYKPLVQSALVNAAEAILKQYLDTANRDQTSIPASMFTLETLTARSSAARMTAELLLGMWRRTNKYIMSIAPKLIELANNSAKLSAYKTRLELHEKRLAALTTKSPETKLSNADLDKILVNMDEADFETDYGSYIAERIEAVRSKLTEDSDAL